MDRMRRQDGDRHRRGERHRPRQRLFLLVRGRGYSPSIANPRVSRRRSPPPRPKAWKDGGIADAATRGGQGVRIPRGRGVRRARRVYANAGISGGLVPLFEQTVEYWREVLSVNLIGAFLAIKHAAPEWRKGTGSIVLHGVGCGPARQRGRHPYSASKAGVISLAQTAANRSRRRRARQRHLPRPDRDRHDKADFRPCARSAARTQDRAAQSTATRRRARGNRRHGAVSRKRRSSYVNGQAFAVDGGLSSTHPFAGPRRRGVTRPRRQGLRRRGEEPGMSFRIVGPVVSAVAASFGGWTISAPSALATS